jgi:hypothetical protein
MHEHKISRITHKLTSLWTEAARPLDPYPWCMCVLVCLCVCVFVCVEREREIGGEQRGRGERERKTDRERALSCVSLVSTFSLCA